MFRNHPALRDVNEDVLRDPKVQIHAQDAVEFVNTSKKEWDVIILDLPDPNDDTLSRLYAQSTYRLVLSRLSSGGALVTQATSPFFAPDAFWCIVETLETVSGSQMKVRPYHVNVPSFGEWGFVMVSPNTAETPRLPDSLATEFIDQATLDTMFHFPRDMARRSVEPNRLTTAVLAKYYRDGWKKFN